MDWKTREETYTSDFCKLGRELGYDTSVTVSSGWWATNVYLIKADHALQMEISREFSDIFLYVVRLKNGNLPGQFEEMKYTDGSWCRVYVESIYRSARKTGRKFGGDFCDETVSAQMRESLDRYLKMIRDDPRTLLDFTERISEYKPGCGMQPAASPKTKPVLPCITAFVLLVVMALCVCWRIVEQKSTYDVAAEERLIAQVNAGNTWAVSDQRAARKGSCTQIDASDRDLYLAYSKSSCVDVYDHNGEFQYAILLPDCQNGAVMIRYEGDHLFVRDKNNTVYVFDGIHEIERMDHSQAASRGYSWPWFEEKKAFQKKDGTFYIETDQFGNVVRKIPLPGTDSSVNGFRVAVFAAPVLIHGLSLVWYYAGKKPRVREKYRT